MRVRIIVSNIYFIKSPNRK